MQREQYCKRRHLLSGDEASARWARKTQAPVLFPSTPNRERTLFTTLRRQLVLCQDPMLVTMPRVVVQLRNLQSLTKKHKLATRGQALAARAA
jgi:hypothetical protein